jgi:hypothetical protein
MVRVMQNQVRVLTCPSNALELPEMQLVRREVGTKSLTLAMLDGLEDDVCFMDVDLLFGALSGWR